MTIVETGKRRIATALGSLLFSVLLWISYSLLNVQLKFADFDISYTLLNGYRAEHSAIVVLVAVAVYYIVTKTEVLKLRGRQAVYYAALSLIFGILNAAGQNMFYLDTLMLGQDARWNIVVIIAIISYSVAFYLISYLLTTIVFPRIVQLDSYNGSEKIRSGVIFFIVIFACWLIWLIAYYPATVDYDSEWQLCTYLGYWERSNHHPWFSSCVLGICYKIGKELANDNLGMFLYVLFRGIILAAIYVRCVQLLKREGARKSVYIAVLLFYAITPVWGAYAKQPFKDTFCAGLFCWFIIRTFILIKEISEKSEIKMSSCLLYTISGLLVSLFRNNYYYVFLITSLILLIVLLNKKCEVLKLVILVLGIVAYSSFNFYIVNYAGVASTEAREALSIPFQQTARTVKYNGDGMDEEEKQAIGSILDFDEIGQNYCPGFADPVKRVAKRRPTKIDLETYFSIWFRQMWKYKRAYIEAFIADSFGYYAFTDDFSPGAAGNYGMVILDEINKDHEAGFDTLFNFCYSDQMDWLRNILENYYHYWHNTPLVSVTDNIPVYTWIIMLVILFFIIRKKPLLTIPPIILIIAILTCIASPVNGSFRYFIPIAAATPVLLACVCLCLNLNSQSHSV